MKIHSSLAGLYMAASIAVPAQAAERQMIPASPELVEQKCEGIKSGTIILDARKTEKDIEYTSLNCFFGNIVTNGNCFTASRMINASRVELNANKKNTLWGRNFDQFSRFVADNCPTM